MRNRSSALLAILLAACAPATDGTVPGRPTGSDAGATRLADQPALIIVKGRIGEGVECPLLTTPDGRKYALSLGDSGFGPGDYVRIEGEIADASFCMQGEGTLIPQKIETATPPPG